MNQLTIFEFDALVAGTASNEIPQRVFNWLEALCLKTDEGSPQWLRLTQRNGRRAIQVTSYVGVLRAPCGFQIEVLPKIGRTVVKSKKNEDEARCLLIQMLKCMVGFRNIQTSNAELLATRMPLLEIFINQFLVSVQAIVKRGLRSDYVATQENLPALRGKILISQHIRLNTFCRDRFFTEHDLFTANRPENRLLHISLRKVLTMTRSQDNQRLARELCFVFDEVPESSNILRDIENIRLDRGMNYYEHALEWAKLILSGLSPLTGTGENRAPSLLFPMEALFEAYVEKHLRKQLRAGHILKAQARSKYLVMHLKQNWFQLKPDLLVKDCKDKNVLVLDTKWKLLDATKNNSREKYQLSQSDFYQLFAYGHQYLNGKGDVVLIFPKTDVFSEPLKVFDFNDIGDYRLWVLPFCLKSKQLVMPLESVFSAVINGASQKDAIKEANESESFPDIVLPLSDYEMNTAEATQSS